MTVDISYRYRPSDSELMGLYQEQRLTDTAVGLRFGVSKVTAGRWRKQLGISRYEPLLSPYLEPNALRTLYCEELLSDMEIAKLAGCTDVTVGNYRKRYGIDTISKHDRLQLPKDLTSTQTSLLIGSMLGDGYIGPKGLGTARYTEYHCTEQRDYLAWKASLWGPFVSSVSPVERNGYSGWNLLLHSDPNFHPYWKLFYPTGKGDKTFKGLDPKIVDPLGLAVWFMDDGSRYGRYCRFSITPESESQQVLLTVLRRFGLEPKLYPKDGTIHIIKDVGRFKSIIYPHMHESMMYKLP